MNVMASVAWAQGAGSADGPGGLLSLVPFILIFVIFYFLLILPQQRKQKEHLPVDSSPVHRNDPEPTHHVVPLQVFGERLTDWIKKRRLCKLTIIRESRFNEKILPR